MDRDHSKQELEPSIKFALDQMLLATPTAADQQDSLARIKRNRPNSSMVGGAVEVRQAPSKIWPFGRAEFAAACLLVVVLPLVASTEAWGQVTRDFADPLNEPKPLITSTSDLSGEPTPEVAPSWGTKLILLCHVGCLLLGLLGMSVAWCVSFMKYFLRYLRVAPRSDEKLSLENRLLAVGLVLYASGTALGAMWSKIAWGFFWQWNPHEVFCLLSIVIGLLWIGVTWLNSHLSDPRENNLYMAHQNSLATIAYGAILAMVPVASQLAASQQVHTYGSPSGFNIVMTVITAFFTVCIAMIWLFYLTSRNKRNAPGV